MAARQRGLNRILPGVSKSDDDIVYILDMFCGATVTSLRVEF